MKITIECTAAEKTEIKRNIKTNQNDTEIIYTIHNKPEDMTCGEYGLSLISWRIKE
jgi:hypothetical protein